MAKIAGLTLEIGGEVTPLNKALGSVNKTSRELKTELKDVERLLKLDPSNTELLNQKQKILAESINNTKEKLSKLKEAEADAQKQFKEGKISEEQYRALQREVIKTEQELGKLEGKAKSTSGAMDLLAKNSDKINGFMKKMTYGFIAAGAALGGLAYKAGASADEINTLAKQTGLSTEEIQKFKYATEIIDVPLETLTGSMAKLTKNMATAQKGSGDAANAFKTLGVKIKDDVTGELINSHIVFEDVIDKLGKMENETQRDAYAMQIFGKSAQDLNPLILGGADALKKLGDEAEAAGLILSQDALDAANDFNDVIDEVKATVTNAALKMGSSLSKDLLPAIKNVSTSVVKFMEWFLKNKDFLLTSIAAVGAMLLSWNVGKMISTVVLSVQALSAALTGATVAQTALNTAMSSNVIGLVLMAVAALAVGIYALVKAQKENITETERVSEKAKEQAEAWRDLKEAQEENKDANVASIDYTNRLWNELKNLTDENGNVLDANKDRASFIVGELNVALGTELELIDGKIKGLKEEQEAIDLMIEKERARRILAAEQEAYDEARNNTHDLQMQQADITIQKIEAQTAVEKAHQDFLIASEKTEAEAAISEAFRLEKAEQNLKKLDDAYNTNEATLNDYYSTISGYESDYTALMSNDYEQIKEINAGVGESFKTAAKSSGEELAKQVVQTGIVYANIQEKVTSGVEGVTQAMADEALVNYQVAIEEYKKVGGAIPSGMEVGVEDGKPVLRSKMLNFIETIKSWFTSKDTGFDVRSPSRWGKKLTNNIVDGLAQGMADHNGALKNSTNVLIDDIKNQIEELNKVVETASAEIKQLEKNKDVSNQAGKKNIDKLIKSKKSFIDTTKENIKVLQEEQKGYEKTAKTIIETADVITESLKNINSSINIDRSQSENLYKLWVSSYGENATEAEKLRMQEESLTEQHNIQADTVNATETAYELMVEEYGEAYEGSRKLYNQLIQEKTIYQELYNSILKVQKAKSDNVNNSENDLREARSNYGEYLSKNYKTLSGYGISASDIFASAKKSSGLDVAESNAKNITINQNITTTAATPSEIREATRNGATLIGKEAYA